MPAHRLLALAALLLLAACGSVPLASLVPLSRIDIRTTDLAELRVALRTPDAIRPRPGGVTLDAVATLEGERERRPSFRLTEAPGAEDLPGEARPGFTTRAYRLDAAELLAFEALRLEVAAKLRQGKRATLGFGIATREFCRLGALPDGPLRTTTWIRTSETGGYVLASDGLDLRGQPEIAAQLPQLAPC